MTETDKEHSEDEVCSGDEQTTISLEAKDMRKKRKPYTLSEKAKEARMANLAKAKEKQMAKEKEKFENLKAKYEAKPEPSEPIDIPEEKPVVKTTYTDKKGKKKVKKVIYEEESDSDSSSSDEEIIVKRKPKKKSSKLSKGYPMPYQFTEAELQQLREEEITRRLKLHEERDEFAKLENEAIKRRYAEKLKEAKMSQFNNFMFPTSNWKR